MNSDFDDATNNSHKEKEVTRTGLIFFTKKKKKTKWRPLQDDVVDEPKDVMPSQDQMKLKSLEKVEEDIRRSLYSSGTQRLEVASEATLPFNKNFLVIHFGTYEKPDPTLDTVAPAEMCIAAFSVSEGLQECYSRMVDPGSVPNGRRFAYMESTSVSKCKMPPFDPGFNFETECMDPLQEFMAKYPSNPDAEGPVYFYTSEASFDAVNKCLRYICNATGRVIDYQLMSISLLIQTLASEADLLRKLNGIKPCSEAGYLEYQVKQLLDDHRLNYIPAISCKFHREPDNQDGVQFCSMNTVKRWIYYALPVLSGLYCCPTFHHTHIPVYVRDDFIKKKPGVKDSDEYLPPNERPDFPLPENVSIVDLSDVPASEENDSESGARSTSPSTSVVSFVSTIVSVTSSVEAYRKSFRTHQIFPDLSCLGVKHSKESRSFMTVNLPSLEVPAPYVLQAKAWVQERISNDIQPRSSSIAALPELETYDPFDETSSLCQEAIAEIELDFQESLSAQAKASDKFNPEVANDIHVDVKEVSRPYVRLPHGLGRGIRTKNRFWEREYPGIFELTEEEAHEMGFEGLKAFSAEYVQKRAAASSRCISANRDQFDDGSG